MMTAGHKFGIKDLGVTCVRYFRKAVDLMESHNRASAADSKVKNDKSAARILGLPLKLRH